MIRANSVVFGVLAAWMGALSLAPSFADQVIQTLPGGDGKEILNNPRDPDHGAGTIIRDEECAKKSKPGHEYEKCVQAKVEKAVKKGNH